MFDLNDVEPIHTGELLPDGSFVKVTMTIRPGGVDGHTEIDKGLLKASNSPGSDVLSLDCEFTVVEGPFAKRKFWQTLHRHRRQGGRQGRLDRLEHLETDLPGDDQLGARPRSRGHERRSEGEAAAARARRSERHHASSPRLRSNRIRIPATPTRTGSITPCCRTRRSGGR